MKNLLLFTIILIFAGVKVGHAQTPVINPIPSYNYLMNVPTAYFYEVTNLGASINKEKRDMDVVVTTRSTSGIPFFAKVWVFRISPNKVLGPFYVLPNTLLTVPIDKHKWGVQVDAQSPVDVSVWTSK